MYIGRFAPSPTGSLHFGSLVAATGSYLDARAHQGHWLVRIEDLDPPREQAGAATHILKMLETYGFVWDGEVLYQSQRHHLYESALEKLKTQHLAYPCTCSRKEILDSALLGIEGTVYPGTCRHGLSQPTRPQQAWRLKTTSNATSFTDAIQGALSQHLEQDIGDFVLKRADGLYAYQLAVVVDDAEQHVTHIVRGADLLTSAPRQIYLQQLLGLPTPEYAHLPIAINQQGEKLSKQTLAVPLDDTNPVAELWSALDFLGQHPPIALKTASLPTLWDWAHQHWQPASVPRSKTIATS